MGSRGERGAEGGDKMHREAQEVSARLEAQRDGAKHAQRRRKGGAGGRSTRGQRKGNAPWGLGARKRRIGECYYVVVEPT